MSEAAPAPSWRRLTPIVAAMLTVAWLAVAIWYVQRGQVNGDEGWYLEAARRVWHGQLPYRDFVFTQTPLAPYVYGLPQLITRSLLVGRITSLVFSVVGLGLQVAVARRLAGRVAALGVLLVIAALPAMTYWLVIVKTYAFVLACTSAVLAAIVLIEESPRRWRWALVAALFATAARSAAGPLALVVFVIGWRHARTRRDRLVLTGIAATAALTLGAFVAAGFDGARYGLLEQHGNQWGGTTFWSRVSQVLLHRLPGGAWDYPGIAVLAGVAVVAIVATRAGRQWWSQRLELLAFVGGLVAFALVQSSAGQFYRVEYFSPLVPSIVTLSVVSLCVASRDRAGRVWPAVATVVIVAVSAMSIWRPSFSGLAPARGDAAPQTVRDAAAYLRASTPSGARVLSVSALAVVYEAQRVPLDGYTLGQFSYSDLGPAHARALGVTDARLLYDDVRHHRPSAVVLTNREIYLVLTHRGAQDTRPNPLIGPFIDALRASYPRTRSFGRGRFEITVFLPA